MAKIMVTPYMAGTVTYAMKNKWLRLRSLHIWLVRSIMSEIMKQRRLLTFYLEHDNVMEREKRLRRRAISC